MVLGALIGAGLALLRDKLDGRMKSVEEIQAHIGLPILGVVWLLRDNLRLEAVPPEPRLIYSVNDKLDLFLGGELLGDAYKRDETRYSQRGEKRFSGGVIDYSEVRGGAGLSYSPTKVFSLDVTGGWDFGRSFDYYRGAGKRFITEGAPYAKVKISAEF